MPIDASSRRSFLHAAAGFAGTGFAMPLIAGAQQAGSAQPAERAGDFNVRAFGATGDGKTLDTDAINRAIEAAAPSGGTVTFPPGNYLCHSIHLKSNIALRLGRGTTIIAADAPAPGTNGPAYDLAEPNQWDHFQDFGHSHWHNSLIWGEKIENVSITGPGLLWGRGLSRGYGAGPRAETPGVANKTISLKNCRNVTLRDFSILHGGHFGILATGVDNLTIDNLLIDTNRDGMDIDCCRNVRVSNCSVNSPWDDGICLKSSFGLGFARATELVTVTNCYVTGDYIEGTLLDGTWKRFDASARVERTGRIKFGTESNGGFRKIAVSNCVFEACQGIALETVDGGLLEDVAISNIAMSEITSAPIFMRLGSRMRGPKGVPVGQLRRVQISNIVCSNSAYRFGSIISGIPGHEIEDVKLSGIHIQHWGGGTAADAAIQPRERENAYPEPDMFGTMPSQGFYVRHVKGLEMSHIKIETMKDDARPAFVFDSVESAHLLRIQASQAAGTAAFDLRSVRDFNLYLSRPWPDTHLDNADNRKI
ncbi:MAG TPA: glycoside hydrolase family 28 protein [Candidatus Acidoferrales bacterium]|nr:glycoside hydrolase family 28 protein [Candidatus Acidoferrales bacterium]